MSLNSDFYSNTKYFMQNRAILTPSSINAKMGDFQLITEGNYASLLSKATSSDKIPGYFVKAMPNSINEYALPTQQSDLFVMYTDQLNGCQFIAYGPDRQHIVVEHNNFISNPALYAERLREVIAQKPEFLFYMSPGDTNNILNHTYNKLQGLNIVGRYSKAAGWSFYVRDRLDMPAGNVYLF